MDPATLSIAFATAKTAYAGIKGAIEIYKDVKATGGELGDIINEVGAGISTFFHGQQQLEEAHEAVKQQRSEDIKAGKPRNVTQEAIENVIRVRQIRQYYKDLEHMVRWELGMPDLWEEIVKERDRLIEERESSKAAQLKAEELQRKKAAYRMARMQEMAWLWCASGSGVLVVFGVVALMMWWVREDRIARWGY